MLTVRRAHERGLTRLRWLESRHSFSFGDYHDPDQMGFGALRVINEDRVEPGQGFGTHSHRDMEILTVVLEGALAHKDSTGGGSTIRPGDLQRMSAGTGVAHSEFNASPTEPVHFLQIWIIPERRGLPPGYEQRTLPLPRGSLRLLASRDGRDGSVTVHQDATLHGGRLEPGERIALPIAGGRHAWIQVARGRVTANGTILGQGDGAAVGDETTLTIEPLEPAEIYVFDLP